MGYMGTSHLFEPVAAVVACLSVHREPESWGDASASGPRGERRKGVYGVADSSAVPQLAVHELEGWRLVLGTCVLRDPFEPFFRPRIDK